MERRAHGRLRQVGAGAGARRDTNASAADAVWCNSAWPKFWSGTESERFHIDEMVGGVDWGLDDLAARGPCPQLMRARRPENVQ